jgi:acetolactate synthase-1/2/3 large subunit
VVATYSGKGAFPEDHPLFAGAIGYLGTKPANQMATTADVIISVGCRFVDWDTSSYRRGASFAIPPAKLIHIDIDPHEIGKNYPAAVGIVADAKVSVAALVDALPSNGGDDRTRAIRDEVAQYRKDWDDYTADRTNSEDCPFTTQRPLRDLRRVLPRDGIVVVGSGNAQGAVKQSWPSYLPRTHMTPGGYSSMGWAVPAAIGAKLGRPDRKVVCIVGDGDFLQTMQEIAVCATNNIAVTFLVLNNAGFISIRGGQRKLMGRHVAAEFANLDGSPYSPDFESIAKNFGVASWRPNSSAELEPALREAVESDAPAVVEVPVARDAAGPWVPGWWDLPVPGYVDDGQDEYSEGRAEEQMV